MILRKASSSERKSASPPDVISAVIWFTSPSSRRFSSIRVFRLSRAPEAAWIAKASSSFFRFPSSTLLMSLRSRSKVVSIC